MFVFCAFFFIILTLECYSANSLNIFTKDYPQKGRPEQKTGVLYINKLPKNIKISWEDKAPLLYHSHKTTNVTKKHQYERDLIELSFIVHKLRNGH